MDRKNYYLYQYILNVHFRQPLLSMKIIVTVVGVRGERSQLYKKMKEQTPYWKKWKRSRNFNQRTNLFYDWIKLRPLIFNTHTFVPDFYFIYLSLHVSFTNQLLNICIYKDFLLFHISCMHICILGTPALRVPRRLAQLG